MSDAQVALLLKIIRTLLEKGIERLEANLSETEFAVTIGQEDNLFNPIRKLYPVLDELYSLRDVLSDGIDDILRTKTARKNNT